MEVYKVLVGNLCLCIPILYWNEIILEEYMEAGMKQCMDLNSLHRRLKR